MIIQAASAPKGAPKGALWIDSNSGDLFVYMGPPNFQPFADGNYPKPKSLFVKQEKITLTLTSGLCLIAIVQMNRKAKTIRILNLEIKLGTSDYKNKDKFDTSPYTVENLLVHSREDYRIIAKALMNSEELQGIPEEDPTDVLEDLEDEIESLQNKYWKQVIKNSWA